MERITYGLDHERLEQLLRSVKSPGDYCVGGRLFTPMPRVTVDGVGQLSFPVPEMQIDALIEATERAPHGRGTETVVDRSVRDCWQIDHEQVRLNGRAWPDSLARVLELVADGLGLPAGNLGAEPYKLLVYRPGGFFAAHRDTEKLPGMVATLSVSLPAEGAGGELVVWHEDKETTFDMTAEEPSELAFAAFYADCLHEARPVTSGHRVSIVFNLFVRSSEGRFLGARDFADRASPIAERLADWRDEGTTDKLVWLLEHGYSEDGLSFHTLKNTDAAVAQVLGEAADRADCEFHAAVLRIEECGLPETESPYGDWGWGPEANPGTTMEEVHDHWEALDGWAARDGSRPPFGQIELKHHELLPDGALDDAEPDDHRLRGFTGNTGPTLELFYRYAALVLWPRAKTVDILASGSIDRAVAWAAGECARPGAAEDGTARRLLARLTELWPVGEESYLEQDRTAMLRLLRTKGEGDVAAGFLQRVVMDRYDGSENEELASVLAVLGPEKAAGFLPGFAEEHLPRRPRSVIAFLARAGASRRLTGNPAWRDVLSGVVGQALSSLGAALEAASEDRAREKADWRYRLRSDMRALGLDPDPRPPVDERMDHEAVRDLFVLAWRLGLGDPAVVAARAIGDHPETVTPDRMLPAALAEMHREEGLAGAAAYGVLWRQAADSLLERSSEPPAEPSDWVISADIDCDCEYCAELRAFCEDPARRVGRFSVRQDLRRHLHRTIERHRLDLDHVTERRGSPYTLVCTKNRDGYRRRLKEYREDLRCVHLLLGCAPEGERRGVERGRVGRLVRAVERPLQS